MMKFTGIHLWEAAANTQSVMNIPLWELAGLSKVYPMEYKKTVWIVENSGFYSSILYHIPEVPLICSHGHFKLAALVLIDVLAKEGCTLYYAGDIEPEGIHMTKKLLLRHPKNAQLWKMGVTDYRFIRTRKPIVFRHGMRVRSDTEFPIKEGFMGRSK